ncbi:MAG: DUF4149 domain-containing protein [Steroidobacteraceae bacterium]
MIRNAFRILFVLWAGSLWSLAAWVAPTLFYAQSDRHLAGALAARLFSIETYVGLGVAALALLLPGRMRFVWGYAAAALLSADEWVLKGILAQAHVRGSVAHLGFLAWHAVSGALYVLACCAVLRLVWKEDFR